MTPSERKRKWRKARPILKAKLGQCNESMGSREQEAREADEERLFRKRTDVDGIAGDVRVLDGLKKLDAATCRLIEKAIAQGDAGHYGICEHCGEAIAENRLKAVPYATQCILCAEGGERPDEGRPRHAFV